MWFTIEDHNISQLCTGRPKNARGHKDKTKCKQVIRAEAQRTGTVVTD